MRTYSHAMLTWAVRRRARRGSAAAVVGAVLPDLPAAAGAGWLLVRRGSPFGREEFLEGVCARSIFRSPDFALHSVFPVGAALAAYGTGLLGGRAGLALLLGWAGHVASDALTHAEDARPILWPLSERRLRGPISYWDRDHHARAFSLVEHATLLAIAALTLGRRYRR